MGPTREVSQLVLPPIGMVGADLGQGWLGGRGRGRGWGRLASCSGFTATSRPVVLVVLVTGFLY